MAVLSKGLPSGYGQQTPSLFGLQGAAPSKPAQAQPQPTSTANPYGSANYIGSTPATPQPYNPLANLASSAGSGYTYDAKTNQYFNNQAGQYVSQTGPNSYVQTDPNQNKSKIQYSSDINNWGATGVLSPEQSLQLGKLQQGSTLQNRALGALSSYQSGPTGGATASSGAGPAREQAPQAQQMSLDASNAAQNAAFGALKARAGSLGRSSVNSLQSDLAERGVLGGGTEARGLTDRLAAATNPLSDLNVAALHENVGIGQHNQDAVNNMSSSNYAGGIAQRGQDISLQQGQEQRALQAQQTKQQQLLQALNGLTALY